MWDCTKGRRLAQGAAAIALAGLVAACTDMSPGPAPVVLKGDGDMVQEGGPGIAPGRPLPPPAHRAEGGRRIVVRPGQSVGGLAEEYHVSKSAIIAANHLPPPYKVEIGQMLIIPGAGERRIETASLAAPSHAAAESRPDVIPLDAPPAPKQAAKPAPAAAPAKPPAPPPSTAEEAHAEPKNNAPPPAALKGGRLAWPVRGHVLAGYGGAAGGRHNDGINIAAPQGTPVKAVDEGIVAYAGNELRGYGNLVLVKHPDGLISAYAHCEELLVKRGDKVTRGEVIAKVGATGGVSEPQLHFELRRGEHAVDPREFLAPSPSAAGAGSPTHG